MPATMQTVSALTKEMYEGSLNKQLNSEVKTLKRIERTSDGVGHDAGGKYVVFPIHTKRNQGIGARNESEALPLPGQQGTAAGRVGLRYLYGRVEVTGQTFELAKTNAQAFVSTIELEMDGLKDDVKKDLNRQVYSDGTGLVARITAAGAGVSTFTVGATNWLQQDMQVDVVDGTTLGNPSPTIKASNRTVTAINNAAKTVTISGATTTVAVGDIIVRTGNVNREWTGLSKIISDTGTLYNIDPTVEPVWKSEVNSNGGILRAISEGMMTEMADRINQNGGSTTVIFQSAAVRRSYANLLTSQRRFSNTQQFTGGFSGLAFTHDEGDIPMVTDVDAPPNTQYYVNEKAIKLYREKDWSFMDRDGGMWQRKQGYDAYEATLFQYSELGTKRRNTHGVIKDITES